MNILMVDDDKDAMVPFIDLLEGYGGHNVTQVQSWSAARTVFNEAAAENFPYDVLILDIQIQALEHENISEEDSLISGLSLLGEFRRKFPQEKVLILTNNYHRVPDLGHDPNLKVCDKVAVSGRRLLDALRELEP